MSDRERYRALMLEHLYGLLDADEARDLEAYLATPEGAQVGAEARRQQQHLAAAARLSFPEVQFVIPPAEVPVRPAGSRVTVRSVGFRWAVAASLLVVLGGLGGPATYQMVGWFAQSSETDALRVALKDRQNDLQRLEAEQRDRRERLRKEQAEAVAAQTAATAAFRDALAAARAAIDEKDFLVRLTGPERAAPGAPNEWRVETLNKQGGFALPRKMELIVKDQKETELVRETIDRPLTPPTLRLSPSFWQSVKPGSDLFLEVVAYTDDNRKSVLAERVPLARPVYVTHLVTDKPLYQPGEILRFRSLTLDRATFLPPAHDLNLQFRLKNPDGAVIPLDEGNGRVVAGLQPVIGPDGKPVRGIGTGEYEIPASAPGGEYTLEVVEAGDRPGARPIVLDTRRFLVNRYTPDVFEKSLEFDGKSYGPGEVVQARLQVSRTAGGPMTDARANVLATVNGKPVYTANDLPVRIVSEGASQHARAVLDVRFPLPADLNAGRPKDRPAAAALSVAIRHGSDVETILRPVPLVEKELQIEFYPEGGDLVAGIPGRVYFQARTPAGKPADVRGTIRDEAGAVVDVATVTDAGQPGVNRGQGVFTFTPRAGNKYFFKLTSPGGITEPTKDGFPLPEVKEDGIGLTALDVVTGKGEPIRVRLQSPKGPKVVHLGAYARGRLIGHERVEVPAGQPVDVAIRSESAVGGVIRTTVFEEVPGGKDGRVNLVPRAERLVYRRPTEQLVLNALPDRNRYTPGARVGLEITAADEKGRPTPAIVMVGVVNQSVLAMADNQTDRRLPTHFLLAGEVKSPADLENADFLLTDHPKAPAALDRLLGTQGWRRFAEQNVLPADPRDRVEVERMLVSNGQRTRAPLVLYTLEEQRLSAEYGPKLEQAAARVTTADTGLERYRTTEEPQLASRVSVARAQAAAASDEYDRAAAELYRFETRAERVRGWALPLFLLGLLALVVGGAALAIYRAGIERRRYVLGTVGAAALGLVVLLGIFVTSGTPESESAYARLKRDETTGYAQATPAPGARFNGRGGADKAPPMAADNALEGPVAPVRGMAPRGGPPALKIDAARGHRDPRAAADAARRDALAGNKNGQRKVTPTAEDREGIDRDRELLDRVADVIRKAAQPAERVGPGAPEAMVEALEPVRMPFVVRQYAHHRDPGLGTERQDYAETVFWHPVLVLPNSGRTRVEFQLSDDVARYRILVAGHTTDGRIGAMTKTIEARKPFTVDPKLPPEVSSADAIDVPVRVVNDGDDRRAVTFTLRPDRLGIEGPGLRAPDGSFKETLQLRAGASGRAIYRVRPTGPGDATLTVIGHSDPIAAPDAVVRAVRVVPDGFPVTGAVSDLLEKRARGTIDLPKDLVAGTLRVRLEVYPTTLADLVKGLDGLLREPSGCFEQSSSTNYPNALILDYLKQTNQANTDASRKARELLERGYGRLVSFECPDSKAGCRQGFEWFGAADRQHEALTAYGLLQFKDMARVHPVVDADLLRRTQMYLLARRDGKGGFSQSAQAIDSFGRAPAHTTNAYIAWSLVESDPDDAEKLDLAREIAALKTEALEADSTGGRDAYFVALVANVLLQRNDRESAAQLLDRLVERHLKDGAVTGAVTSITRSGGRDLEIETTALALLGWLRANDAKYAGPVRAATRWISRQRGGTGGFGSTQSTILALKALALHARKNAHPAEGGEVQIRVGGKPVGTRRFTPDDVEVVGIDVPNAEELFPPGTKTEVEIVTDARHPYPFALTYSATTRTPASADQCALRLTTSLGKATADEGGTLPLTVTLENRQKAGQGMAVAVVGLPAGARVPSDMKQLIELREKGVISFFETRGRELVLYWRELAPEQKISLAVDLVCDVPGEYRGPASRAYLYYTSDLNHWVEPLAVRIRPAGGPEASVAQK